MLSTDVAVVGGGPAGAAAAITLARHGRDVVLVDKARFPRDKCCGDGLTAGALRLLEQLGLDPTTIDSWHPVSDVVVRSPSGHQVVFPLPRGRGLYAAVARRVDLDSALIDVARSAGVKVLDGHALLSARNETDRIVLDVDGIGTVQARYALGADGMWSPLRKALGAADAGYLGEWHAFRGYFADVSPEAARDLFVWFEPDLLPGYAWSFPLPDGRANVGFGIQRGGKVARVQDMKQLWPQLLDRPHVRDVLGPSGIRGGTAQGVADSGARRLGSAHRGTCAVRRRCRVRDRPDDGRGHRPSAADRNPCGARREPQRRATMPARAICTSRPSHTTSTPTTECLCS